MFDTAFGGPGVSARCAARGLVLAWSLPLWCAIAASDATPAAAQETEAAVQAPVDALVELRSLLDAGDYDEAAELLAAKPEDRSATLLRARLLRETGRGAAALALIEASAAYVEGDPAHRVRAGALRDEAGDRAGAEREYRAVLAKTDRHIEATARLGLLLIEQGKRADGTPHLERLIDLYRGFTVEEAEALPPVDYVWLGRACEGLNRLRDAHDVMYSSALDLDPACLEALLSAGGIMMAVYNYPDSRGYFKDALNINPRLAEAHIGLARASFIDPGYPEDRVAAARASLAAAARVWNDHPQAVVLEGEIAFLHEDWPRAEECYRRALAVDPLRLDRQGLLAALLFTTGRLDELAALEREIARLHPLPAAFYAALAAKLVDRFFYREAADYARKAMDIDGEYWPAYTTYSLNALRTARVEEGREWLEKAFERDRFNPFLGNTLTLYRHLDKNFIEERSENFLFRMERADMPFLLPYLRPLLEDAKLRMEREYEVVLRTPIEVEDFSSHKWFSARSVGLPGVSASGVCFGQFMTLTTPKAIPGNWGAIALHEFAHVISLQKSGQRVPRWLTEGMSVFEEGRDRPRWRRIESQSFVDAVHNDGIFPLGRIQGAFMNAKTILLAYFQGGVMCSYIAERWGFEKLPALLDGYRRLSETAKVFPEVLSVTPEEFDRGFLDYARRIADASGLGCRYPAERIPALQAAAEKSPGDPGALVRLGFAYLFNDKTADAELTVGKLLGLAPDHPEVAALRGFIHHKQKKKSAVEALEKAIAGGTSYKFQARVALATLLRDAGERKRAIALLREAIQIHPDGIKPLFARANPYYLLAELLNQEGSEGEAISVLEQLVRTDRDDLKVRKQLASHYRVEAQWGKVVAVLEDAVYIDPYDVEVHQLLAQACLETQAYRSALRELEVLLQYDNPPYNRIYPDIARCHLRLGDRVQAESFARKALELEPENARALEVLEELGR